jgi:putative component of membrane protein insertase Oxa1/YidC/SpoIIIJ protein YidD
MRFKLLLLLPLVLLAKEPYSEPWGADASLRAPRFQEEEAPPPNLATRLADALIRFHQEVLSPVDGPRSHFRPSSSRYMQLAIQRYGIMKGYVMGCDRLLRENDEKWVYSSIEMDGKSFKYDPACEDKHQAIR